MRRILLTGPSDRIDDWADAVRKVGWEPIPFPLIDIEELGLRPEALFGPDARFDWLCVTSRSALPFVERLAECSPAIAEQAACVGEFATLRVRDLGFRTPVRAARDAQDLAGLVADFAAECAGPRSTILWPRGDRATDLATDLRAGGFAVEDPVVYASRALAIASAPRADAVFFASPSACGVWLAACPANASPPLAIAIGNTTFEALLGNEPTTFERVTRLAEPTPAALAFALGHVEP
jgi:uroporphyrinogen-III synthase